MRKRIGELLVEAGASTSGEVEAALAKQRAGGKKRLGEILRAAGKVTPTAVAKALATQYELPFVELPEAMPGVSGLVPASFQLEHRMVVFRVEKEGSSEILHVAVADPTKEEPIDELRFQLSRPVRLHVAAEDDVDGALAAMAGEPLDVLEPVEDDDTPSPVPSREVPDAAPKDKAADPELPQEWEIGPTQPSVPAPGRLPTITQTTPMPQVRLNRLLATPWPPAASPLTTPWPPSTPPPALVRPWDVKAPAGPREPPAGGVEIDLEEGSPPAGRPAPAEIRRPTARAILAAADAIEAQLGARAASPPPPAAPAPAAPAKGPAPVKQEPGPATAPAKQEPTSKEPPHELSELERMVLEGIERLARGEPAGLESEKVRPPQMVASLIRLLIKKGVIQELEFLDELARK
ncbi:MAG: general secretion pathway protein GspE [Myxococcales bacterium]|nr:general secretion pathway protein GspE [Myxococcales bacterium]